MLSKPCDLKLLCPLMDPHRISTNSTVNVRGYTDNCVTLPDSTTAGASAAGFRTKVNGTLKLAGPSSKLLKLQLTLSYKLFDAVQTIGL